MAREKRKRQRKARRAAEQAAAADNAQQIAELRATVDALLEAAAKERESVRLLTERNVYLEADNAGYRKANVSLRRDLTRLQEEVESLKQTVKERTDEVHHHARKRNDIGLKADQLAGQVRILEIAKRALVADCDHLRGKVERLERELLYRKAPSSQTLFKNKAEWLQLLGLVHPDTHNGSKRMPQAEMFTKRLTQMRP